MARRQRMIDDCESSVCEPGRHLAVATAVDTSSRAISLSGTGGPIISRIQIACAAHRPVVVSCRAGPQADTLCGCDWLMSDGDRRAVSRWRLCALPVGLPNWFAKPNQFNQYFRWPITSSKLVNRLRPSALPVPARLVKTQCTGSSGSRPQFQRAIGFSLQMRFAVGQIKVCQPLL